MADVEPSLNAADRKAEEQSLGELFAELSRETSTLMRHEVTLAKAELSEKASSAGKNIGFLAAGGAVVYAGLLVLLAAAVMGLDEFMPTGLAALIVGLVVAAIGYILVQKGLNTLKNMELAPRETIESLKEDKEWLQKQI
jgi:hypothetical protein